MDSLLKCAFATTILCKNAQTKVDKWINAHGVRYFNELTNMAILTEEVGEVADDDEQEGWYEGGQDGSQQPPGKEKCEERYFLWWKTCQAPPSPPPHCQPQESCWCSWWSTGWDPWGRCSRALTPRAWQTRQCSPRSEQAELSWQCTMCTLYSIFSSQPNKMGHDITLPYCDIIQHIFIPTRSVARKTLLWTFLWASNSKFVIFPELYPCINYRILAFYAPIPVQIHGNSIIPLYRIQGNFEYRGILLYNVRIVQWASGLRTPVLPAQEADWQPDPCVSQSLFTADPSGRPTDPWNAMEALRPLFDHQKLTFMLIAAGVPKKLNQDLVKCDTDEEDSVAYHTILTLFALVLHFYRELSQLMDDCTGRQSAHKLRALKPHPRHFQTFIHLLHFSARLYFISFILVSDFQRMVFLKYILIMIPAMPSPLPWV